MMSKWAPVFLACLFLTTPIAAQEQAVLGQGNVSCGSWLEDREGDSIKTGSRIAWILGYLTAFNQYGSRPRGDVSGGEGTEELMIRVDDYCRQHRDENLYSASAALVNELRLRLGR